MENIVLDKKDKKILYELDCNSRQSYSIIGKKVKMSKESVHYRVKRLEKNKIILGYYTMINPMRLGYWYFRIGINYHNIDNVTLKKLIDFLKKVKEVSWLGSHENIYDIVAVVLVNSIDELYLICKSISYNFQEHISKMEVTPGRDVHCFKSRAIHGINDQSYLTLRGKNNNVKIDDKDKIILKFLADARISAVELGQKCNLTAKNVINRIKRLENKKVIVGYLTNFNYQILGLNYLKILLYLTRPTRKSEESIKSYLKTCPELLYISDAIGLADIEFEVVLRSHNAMYEFIDKLRDKFPTEIRDYKSMVIHKVHKIKYFGYFYS
ncbi:MAG: Lrp/AsnC family transcriptional regulator [Nanoarchaeota archaeon]|nr:Lrp/AsnC family transcriptional regulator [Nanoarchaeota archaeon]